MPIVGALPFTLQNGTTADATEVMADFNTIKDDVNNGAAALGANNDITSLAGLTTPLSIAQGGTAAITAAAALASLGAALSGVISNLTLVASVAASALTIAIKDASGADPTASSPIRIGFRSATVTSGDYAVLSITAATNLVVSSGSTLGAVNNIPFRLWIVGFNDGGTFRLGVVNTLLFAATGTTSNDIFALRDDEIISSTAEGGAGAADSALVVYTGAAVTSKAYRILGYMEWNAGLGTVGTWSAGPTKIQLFGPGVPKPGERIQRRMKMSVPGTVVSGTALIPADNSTPQNTEGDQFFSKAITPTATMNVLEITLNVMLASSTVGGNAITSALFQDSTAAALAARTAQSSGTNAVVEQVWTYRMRAGTVSSTTFNIRVGGNAAGTTTLNSASSGSQLLDAAATISTFMIEELMT